MISMKPLQTYLRDCKANKAYLKTISPKIRKKALFESLFYAFILTFPLLILWINLFIYVRFAFLLSILIVLTVLGFINLQQILYYEAIFYFENAYNYDKIIVLKWIRIVTLNILTVLLSVVILVIIFGGNL